MDIREVLRTDAADLLDEELEMLEEELATGDYDAFYRKECEQMILDERHVRKIAHLKAKALAEGATEDEALKAAVRAVKQEGKTAKNVMLPSALAASVQVSPDKLSPFNNVNLPEKTPYETVSADVSVIRRSENSMKMLREYLKKQPLIDEAFLDKHLSLFEEDEMKAILDQFRFSEQFLEKYLSTLGADRVAKTQLFSEEFFMHHFAEFDPMIALEKGKNPWCKKENRSRKLDTFLRLKGVRI